MSENAIENTNSESDIAGKAIDNKCITITVCKAARIKRGLTTSVFHMPTSFNKYTNWNYSIPNKYIKKCHLPDSCGVNKSYYQIKLNLDEVKEIKVIHRTEKGRTDKIKSSEFDKYVKGFKDGYEYFKDEKYYRSKIKVKNIVKKKLTKAECEKKIRRYKRIKPWIAPLVTTVSIVLGVYSNYKIASYESGTSQFDSWGKGLSLGVLAGCIFAIILSFCYDKYIRKIKLRKKIHFSDEEIPAMTNKFANIDAEKFDELIKLCNAETLVECMTAYDSGITKILSHIENVFNTDIADDDEMTEPNSSNSSNPNKAVKVTARYMFKSCIDGKMALLWGKEDKPGNCGARMINCDTYEKTDVKIEYYEDDKKNKLVPPVIYEYVFEKNSKQKDVECSKILLPIYTHSSNSKLLGVVILKIERTTEFGYPYFYDVKGRGDFWLKTLRQPLQLIELLNVQWHKKLNDELTRIKSDAKDNSDVNKKYKNHLSEEYKKFAQKNGVHTDGKNYSVIL